MYELFIEGFKVDIDQKLSVQLTFAIDDISNFSSRETGFSKTIILPGTGRNNQIFGFIFDIGSFNYELPGGANIGSVFNAAQTSRAELRLNGLLVLKGVFRITNIIKDKDIIEYEGALFGELSGFVSQINNKKLEDLDFSLYNHNYTQQKIVNSWDNKITKSVNGIFTTITDTIIIDSFYDLSDIEVGDEIIIEGASDLNNNDTYNVISISLTSAAYFIGVNKNLTNNLGDSFTITYSVGTGKGYYYPLIDYGTYSSDKINYDIKTFRPALYVKEYIDKIFEDSGYRYSSEFLNSSFFKTLIIPNNFSKLTKKITDLIEAKNTTTQTFLNTSFVPITKRLKYNSIPLLENFTIANQDTFTYTGDDTQIALKINIIGSAKFMSTTNDSIRFNLRLGDNSFQPVIYSKVYSRAAFGNSVNINIDETIISSIKTNDIFYIEVIHVRTDSGTEVTLNNLIVNSLNPITADIQENDFLSLNTLIPKNITQKDFFTWIVKMFNLYIYEDKLDDKVLNIVPYKDFLNNEQLDWTFKISRDKPWQIKPMGLLNSRFFEYKYKEDNDFYNEGYKKKYNLPYGSNLQDTQFQFAKDKQTVEVGFSPTVLVQYETTDKVLPAIYKKSKGNAVDQEELTDSNIRILLTKKMTGVDGWYIQNAGVNLGSQLTSYGYAGHFDDPLNPTKDINFGANSEIYFDPNTYPTANLFNTYWSGYIAEIVDKDSKLLTCHARLTPLDIAQLDFSKPIIVDSVLFRLNKIEDYDYRNDELVKVELLKVINFKPTCSSKWTKKNYTGTTFRNGDTIPEVTNSITWATTTSPAWCYYNNDPSTEAIYGKLYNWYAINDPRGFAPEGYRVPSVSDWDGLIQCLGGESVAGGKLKSLELWDSPNTGATNEDKFNGIPSGVRTTDLTFEWQGQYGYFWTSEAIDSDNAYCYYLSYQSSDMTDGNFLSKKYGVSVRLIKE